MPLDSLALVLLAAFTHATWNLLAKRAAEAGSTFVFAYSLVASIAYAPWVIWTLWGDVFAWSAPIVACTILSGLLHLAYSLCLQRGYQAADLSVVYPVARGTGPLVSSVAAVTLLGEPVTPAGVSGLLAVVAGIALIATNADLTAFRRPGALVGVRWGAGTGALIASYTVVDGYGVKTLGAPPVVLDWFANALRLILLAPVVLADLPRSRERMRGRWLLALGVGLLAPLGYILVLIALQRGAPVSLVAPTRELSLMIGAVLGMLVLHERVTAGRLIGCAVMVAGVALLSLA